LAIFHLTATVISRARGQSAVAAAAYRSGTTLRDERYGTTHYYAARRRVAQAQILAPRDAPEWVHDRQTLWNRVEARERRKDAQLARVIEVGLPIELSAQQSWALVRDYALSTFVARGMIADVGVRFDNPANPHAHLLLTLRAVTGTGFGPKARHWNGKANLLEWRAAWAHRANDHLARAGHAVRIDHRTLEAQQIELTPARRTGIGRPGARRANLPEHLLERRHEQREIAAQNGAAMLADPTLALRTLAQARPSFTLEDLAAFLRSRTAGQAQFDALFAAVQTCGEWVALAPGDEGVARFTARDLLEAAKSLRQRALTMAARRGHGASPALLESLWTQCELPARDRPTVDYLLDEGDAKAVMVAQEVDREILIEAFKFGCAAQGLEVLRLDPSTLGANLERWQQAQDVPTGATVVLADDADLVSVKPLERLLAVVERVRGKVVLLADAARARAMQDQSPFHIVWSQAAAAPAAGRPA
jgi:hypothetical protein